MRSPRLPIESPTSRNDSGQALSRWAVVGSEMAVGPQMDHNPCISLSKMVLVAMTVMVVAMMMMADSAAASSH